MIKTAIILAMLFSISSFAEDKKSEHFKKAKDSFIEHLTKQITMLTAAKSCVTEAADRKALRECRIALREGRKSDRDNRRSKRKDGKGKRKRRLETGKN